MVKDKNTKKSHKVIKKQNLNTVWVKPSQLYFITLKILKKQKLIYCMLFFKYHFSSPHSFYILNQCRSQKHLFFEHCFTAKV